ncbi:MAG: GIY-YIG nuclease family protein [Bacteroidetes bacterium]|nr:GIY-YIG nuclease family protein [Bacteroidota bacterium]MBL0065560.1 GIY-YIG nuclease family protein [Bacteroidota bacterium]MBL0065561.1 GIY-YIG nuclease family protein [Bacteroidota bacterium]MBL0065564.1 GIY-YIG nuclease family protein [Bacteroidota bacterium]MBL0140413.1 GIY-YIG nuclease family protein [Bacteroidota bacterium]
MMFFVYIIYSSSHDVYYKGVSEEPLRRLEEHNSDRSRYTSGKGPWELVYTEQLPTKRDALIREKQIKKWNRETIERAISTHKS